MTAPPRLQGYDFRTAHEAVRALMKDPNDVAQVFRVVNALPGRSLERCVKRLRRTASGRRLLKERPALAPLLLDRDYLASLPAGSLGRAYLDFVIRENIGAEGLLEADEVAGWKQRDEATAELTFVRNWMRDTHDLWHVVTGYEADLLGETGILAYLFTQTWNPGIGFIAVMVFLKGGREFAGMRRIIIEGFVRGLRSGWLLGHDWCQLLSLPIDEVRKIFQIPQLRPYTPLRVSDLPGGVIPAL